MDNLPWLHSHRHLLHLNGVLHYQHSSCRQCKCIHIHVSMSTLKKEMTLYQCRIVIICKYTSVAADSNRMKRVVNSGLYEATQRWSFMAVYVLPGPAVIGHLMSFTSWHCSDKTSTHFTEKSLLSLLDYTACSSLWHRHSKLTEGGGPFQRCFYDFTVTKVKINLLQKQAVSPWIVCNNIPLGKCKVLGGALFVALAAAYFQV